MDYIYQTLCVDIWFSVILFYMCDMCELVLHIVMD